MKSSNKILTIAVILLLLLNIAMVIFIVNGRNHPDIKRPGKGPLEMLEKELNMTEQQKTEVKRLRDAHFATIHPLFDSVRAAKAAFFGLVKEANISDSVLNIYSKRITETQATIDKLTFAHFQQVRKLFDTAQQKKYDEFVLKMMQRGKKDSTGRKK